jgi:hypothetical protein
MSNNSTTNVSAGKPKVGGAIFVAPSTETLPTDATTALPESFVCVGYISDDGVNNKIEMKNNDIQAWGGDTVLNAQESRAETYEFTMIETNEASLKQAFGEENVTVDGVTKVTTVKHNGLERKAYVYVVEMIMTGNRVKRTVIPNGKVTDIGEIKYVDKEPIGYDTTITALPDASGNTAYDYIASTGA